MVRFVEDGGESPGSVSSGPELAPVIPLFGGPLTRADECAPTRGSSWDDGRTEDDAGYAAVADDARSAYDDATDEGAKDDSAKDDSANAAIDRENAENILLKRLRTRQLSVAEARTLVSQRGLGADEVDSVLEDFLRRLTQRGLVKEGTLAFLSVA